MQMSSQTETAEDKPVVETENAPVDDTSSIQTSIETTTGLERCLTVTVPAKDIDAKVVARINELMPTSEIKGFRKGKVPFKVIKRRLGDSIRYQVLTDIINETFQETIVAESLKPAAQPDIDVKPSDEGKDLEYTATFEIYPEIKLTDFSAIELTNPSADIGDGDIDKMIERLRKQQMTYEPVERKAAIDDQVTIDYSGVKDGEPFAGGQAEGQTLVLGSNSMIPGFEDSIVGMSVGEEKVAPLSFPEDYHAEELKGAKVEFTIKLQGVAEQTLPPLDDEFLTRFGVADGDMDKFRKDVRNNMQRELESVVKSKVKKQVIDKLIESHSFELPKALIANEIDAIRQQMASQFPGAKNQKLDLKAIFPDDKLTEEAQRRVSFVLLASEISKANNITVDGERVRSEIDKLAETYEQPETVVNYYYQNPQLLNQVQSSVLEDQVIEAVSRQAQVKDEKVDYFELVT